MLEVDLFADDDPTEADTDGDDHDDGVELAEGTSPFDDSDYPGAGGDTDFGGDSDSDFF